MVSIRYLTNYFWNDPLDFVNKCCLWIRVKCQQVFKKKFEPLFPTTSVKLHGKKFLSVPFFYRSLNYKFLIHRPKGPKETPFIKFIADDNTDYTELFLEFAGPNYDFYGLKHISYSMIMADKENVPDVITCETVKGFIEIKKTDNLIELLF